MADKIENVEQLLSRNWERLCFHASFYWIMFHHDKNPKLRLIHCRTDSSEGRMVHAFCVDGKTVIDLTLPPSLRFMDRKEYWLKLKPTDVIEYSWPEALRLGVRCEHFGPWEMTVADDESHVARKNGSGSD
jgi:hypothetical protein